MYAVIEWLETTEVSVVAYSWLHSEKGTLYSYWPPSSMKLEKQQKALKQQCEAGPDWPRFPAKVVRREGNCMYKILHTMLVT